MNVAITRQLRLRSWCVQCPHGHQPPATMHHRHPPRPSKLETSGLFKTWLSPQSVESVAALTAGASGALPTAASAHQNLGTSGCRAAGDGGAASALSGNFSGLRLSFYNNFHKILYWCVSGLEHLWFSAQRLLGLATFCPLFGQTAAWLS